MIRMFVVGAAAVLTAACTSSSVDLDAGPATPTRGSTSTTTGHRSGGDATVLLARLPVKGRAPLTGYDRDLFGQAWSDDNNEPLGHNGCDTRNDILRRDLTTIVLKPGTRDCVVLRGVLDDPYTGLRIAFTRGVGTSEEIQIDHVVALADAWQTGAQSWSAEVRVDFANDPLNLLAVQGTANQQKGAGDAATWLPPDRDYRCRYVARQVAVKARYGLAVTAAEGAAMSRVLAGCDGTDSPTEGGLVPR